MRVLMTADTVGGVFTHAVELAAGLGGKGVEVALATFGRRMSADQRRRVRESGAQLVLESPLALEWMPEPWADVEAAEELLLELERRLAPDVVHLNAFAHGAAAWQAPVLVAGHSCVCSWWAAVHGQSPPPSWSRYRAAVRHGIAGCDVVTAPTRTMLGELERWHGPLPPCSRPILNGSAYQGPAVAPPKRPVVLSAGRLWDEGKNAAALVRVAARPRLRDRVLLAGEGDAGGEVNLLGPLDPAALAQVRREAAVYAAPSLYEPFGLGILEAARDHCALVLSDIPSLRELWDGAAVFVAPGDDEQLADVVERLLADPAAAAALGAQARRQARRYAVPAMTEGYVTLYRTIIGARERVVV